MRMAHHLLWRAGTHDIATRIAAFGTQIDQPIRRSNDIEVVLDDEQRMTSSDQSTKRTEQLFNVIEVQPGGRLVEDKQRAESPGFGPYRHSQPLQPDAPRV